MSIQLTYLNRAFHGLSIDMSHDPEHIFSIFGVVPPLATYLSDTVGLWQANSMTIMIFTRISSP